MFRKVVVNSGHCALILTGLLMFSLAEHRHRHNGKHHQGETVKHPMAFETCQEKICASRVSACLLMEECDCTVESCSCCANCMRCLGSLWKSCCDCVGLCMPPNKTTTSEMSTVGNLRQAVPSLFKILINSNLPVVYQDRQPQNSSATCQVAFYNDCMTLDDCLGSCRTMGASGYRWFHNGCCQCVGERCHDFGEASPHCTKCSNN